MTTPAWPSTLPRPLAAGYELEPTPAVLRTDMDSGTARQRQRFTRTPTTAGFSVNLTDAQYALLEAWWFYKLHQGTDWFAVQLANGEADEVVSARFKDKPLKATLAAPGVWSVPCSLEVEQMPRMSEDDLDDLLP